MTRICGNFSLSGKKPKTTEIEAETDGYLAHLIQQWRTPLAEVEVERLGIKNINQTGGGIQC